MRKDEEVALTNYRSNAQGIVEVPLEAGGEYLLNAVMMLSLNGEDKEKAVWYSLWANLTFKTSK